MLRLQDLPPEQRGEAVRTASELYDKETTEQRELKATVDAAEEVGIPAEYLERASAEIHARRVAEIKARRKRNRIIAGAAVGTALLGLVGTKTYNALQTPAPVAIQVAQTTGTTFRLNPSSEGELLRENGRAVLRVNRFVPEKNGSYFANIDVVPSVRQIGRYRSVTFSVGGSGSLQQMRLYLENGNERWRSQAFAVPTDPQKVTLNLKQFEYQQRDQRTGNWRTPTGSYKSPDTVGNLSFKVGEFMNPPSASGEVSIGNVTFE